MKRLALVLMVLICAAFLVAIQAQEPVSQPRSTDSRAGQIKDDLILREQILARQFAQFENALLQLKQRLERSPKQEDRDRALILGRALDKAKDSSISVQFEQLVDFLKGRNLSSLPEIKTAQERASNLAEVLREVLTLLREDTRASKLRDDRIRLEQLVKEIERLILEQRTVQGLTDINKTDRKELEAIQHRVTTKTADLGKKVSGEQDADPKNSKGASKDSAKAGDKAGKAKDAGAEANKGESKDGGKDDKGSKIREKPGEVKTADKQGDPKDKSGDKQAGAKSGSKGGEPKDAQAKNSGQPKQGEAKPGQKNDGQAQAKSGEQQPPQNAKDAQQPPPQQAQAQPGKKQIEDANYKQKQAEENIKQGKNPDASEKQDQAVRDLEAAKKKLEELLNQMREEELERLLAALQARCERMLAMQTAVLVGTEHVFKSIESVTDKKPSREDQQRSLKLSDDEKEIIVEASKAIEMLEAEGSAVAFPEVFQQMREDMKHVQRRLGVVDTGVVPQGIEQDISTSLKEMIEALKKARREMDDKKNPSDPKNMKPRPPGDQKLLDQIAELKMIRSLQKRVNDRTELYGKQYQAVEGEQTNDQNIRLELRNLAERQERIFDVTNRIAKGDNK